MKHPALWFDPLLKGERERGKETEWQTDINNRTHNPKRLCIICLFVHRTQMSEDSTCCYKQRMGQAKKETTNNITNALVG